MSDGMGAETGDGMGEGAMLAEAAGRLFAELLADWREADAGWTARAWQAVAEMGLPLALVPEDAGGFGLATADALALIRLAGAHALPLPLAETMIANRLLAEAGLPLAEGMAAIAADPAQPVAWGRLAGVCAFEPAPGRLARIAAPAVVEAGTSLAAQPFDRLALAGGAADAPRAGHALHLWGAAARTLQIAGALETVLALTIGHVSERQQFGRTLSKFQAVQHEIARIGGEVAAASAAADMAAEAIARPVPSDPTLAIAAARVRSGEAVGLAAGIAQQLHGAIGFTREHQLHRYTTALWAWREDFGTHRFWTGELGRAALAAGSAGYWAFVTEAA